MKKSLIALAVAGALAAPMVAQADATLYGSLRVKMVDTDTQEMDIADNSSRIGIKGSSELFSGAKAIYQFEQAVSSEAGAWAGGRLSYIGATGDFGTAQIGRMWTPYALWTVFTTDIVDNGTSGSSGYVIGAHRTPETLAYISPDMGGFQVAGAILTTDTDTSSDSEVANNASVDVAHVAAKFEMAGFMGAVSYLGYDEDTTVSGGTYDDVTSVGLSYTLDALYVGARYEDRDLVAGDDEQAWELAGSYSFGNTKLLANYIDDDANDDEKWSVEAQQKLGKQARVFAAYVEHGDDSIGNGVELGYRVDF
ncbi:porin [Marinobacterium sp. D7]|uniref:porin n=1 Tax=Marinobacterium ramblicola TaxID=2849041 RepID=UPI001C2CC67F|nr:porin [Marinobacterium ramblicola]MBV1789531.1 porin [Marinobacterium ramblicola]